MEANLKKKVFSFLTWPFLTIAANIWMFLILLSNLIPHRNIKAGTKFVAFKDFTINVPGYYNAPGTFGFKCKIPKDFVFIVSEDSNFGLLFEVTPENTKEFEKKFIPEETKNDPKFAGYRIHLKISDIGRNIKEN